MQAHRCAGHSGPTPRTILRLAPPSICSLFPIPVPYLLTVDLCLVYTVCNWTNEVGYGKQLTARQRKCSTIRNFFTGTAILPLSGIWGRCSIASGRLYTWTPEKKGWITANERQEAFECSRLCPTASAACQIPVLGTIAAGVPLLAVGNVESYISVPPEMVKPSDELFALRVRGDSMIDDHIADGDIIVVRSQEWAESGQIVAALIGDEATVKRLDTRSQPPRLMPANRHYDPIELTPDNIQILGRVIGLFRAYQTV